MKTARLQYEQLLKLNLECYDSYMALPYEEREKTEYDEYHAKFLVSRGVVVQAPVSPEVKGRKGFRRFRGIKWHKEKQLRQVQLCALANKRIDLFGVWHDMLYPVSKVITITGHDPEEVSQMANAEMAQISAFRSFDKPDAPYPGYVKRLHSLVSSPEIETKQTQEDGLVKITTTISYAQYALKPGFTEEEFYAAAEASDKATEEYLRYEQECVEFGMKI